MGARRSADGGLDGTIAGGVNGTGGNVVQPLALLPSRFVSAVVLPSTRIRGEQRPIAAVAAVLLAAGLFSVSWERLANLTVLGYNVKLPVVLFSLAADQWGLFGLAARRLDMRDLLTVAFILAGSILVILAGAQA